MLVVDVESLWVRYGPLAAVRGISLHIPRGEVFGFIGPNGAGKSSTIKVLATLLRDFTGKVKINGLDVLHKPQAVREKIGYVPDFFGVYEDLTVEEYLHFFAAAYRIDRPRQKSADIPRPSGLRTRQRNRGRTRSFRAPPGACAAHPGR